jgi:hypothetical protein
VIPSAPLDEVLAGAQFVFLAMNHDAFRALTVEGLRRQCAPAAVVADVWNVLGTGRVVFQL